MIQNQWHKNALMIFIFLIKVRLQNIILLTYKIFHVGHNFNNSLFQTNILYMTKFEN